MTNLFSQTLGWRALLGASLALAAPLLLGSVVLGPQAPGALAYADSLVLAGELDEALVRYTAIEDKSWSQERAATAALHAGSAAALGGKDQVAIVHLKTFLRNWPADPRATQVSLQLASLLADQDPKAAARALVAAADADPENPSAHEHVLQAAELLERAAETTAAWSLYQRVHRTWPEQGDTARLAMARMRLQVGDAAAAQDIYEELLVSDAAPEILETARLGLSIAQEDLGDFDSVLADLNELDMSEAQRTQRRDRVLGRIAPLQ
ncbi:MAG: tetratricopeptide (TPR) repeat protein [Cognaticolwellia sp.]|jgi:tetratricopeptide (TPR) repeat protein